MTGFQRVFAAELVSTFGSLMSRLAIPWLAVLVLGAGPAQMAWLAMADVIAGAVASLALGVLVDRWPKRATMIACDLTRALCLLAIPLLWWAGWLAMPWLVLIVTLNGVLTIAFELAQSAWIARATAAHELGTRNAQMAAGGATVEAASFGVTGWLFQWLGGIAAIVVDAASYLLSAAFLRRLPEPPPLAAASDAPPAPRTVAEAARGLARQTRTGLRAIADDATLRALALLTTLISFAGGLGATSYMIYVTRDLAFSTGVLGMIFAVGGVGSVGGAWLATRLDARVGAPRALFAGLVLGTLGAIAAPLATGATLVGVLLLCAQQIVGDAGLTVYQVHDRTLRQARAPAAALARVDAGLRTLGHLGTLAGALVGGIAAEALGARAMLFAMAAIYACAAIGAWLWLPRRAPAVA